MKYLKKFNTEPDVVVEYTPCVYLIDTTKVVGYVNSEIPVKIQHIDGTLYSQESWIAGGFTNDEANGIVVLAKEGTILISKEQGYCEWGNYSAEINGTSENFGSGESNTTTIIETIGNNNDVEYAASVAASYVFPDGKTGFLPSNDELIAIVPYIKLINSLLAIIGGMTIKNDIYHLSYTDNRIYESSYMAEGINMLEPRSITDPFTVYSIYRRSKYYVLPIRILD